MSTWDPLGSDFVSELVDDLFADGCGPFNGRTKMASRADRELAAAVVRDALDDDNLDDIRRSLKKKLRPKLPRWFPIGRILRFVLPALRDEIEGILLGPE